VLGKHIPYLNIKSFGEATNVADQHGKSIHGSVVIPALGVQPGFSENKRKSVERNISRTDFEERTGVKQIDGFNINPMNLGRYLIFLFCIPTSMMNNDNLPGLKRYRNTFTPKILGHWDLAKEIEDVFANYSFKVERHLFHMKENAFIAEGGC